MNKHYKKIICALILLMFILFFLFLYTFYKNVEAFTNEIELINWWNDTDENNERSKTIFDELFDETKYKKIKVYSVFGEPDFGRVDYGDGVLFGFFEVLDVVFDVIIFVVVWR